MNNQVYLDRDQCSALGVDYMTGTRVVVAADAILNSKKQGYDEYHHNILEPFGSKTLVLTRDPHKDPPGWFSIAGANP